MLPLGAPSFDPRVEVLMTRRPITIAPTASIESAAALMRSCRIRHLPVVEGKAEKCTLVGVLSSRDVLAAPDDALVADVMSRSPVTVRPEHGLASACERMLGGRFSCLPVMNDDEHVIGIFTGTDALRFAVTALEEEGRALRREPEVAQLMTGRPLIVVSPTEQLRGAWTMMSAGRVRHAPVVTDGLVIGMLSDRDVLAAGREWLSAATPDRVMLVADAMSTRVSIVPAESLARDAAKILLQRRVGALTVVRGKTLVGILTVSDFMHWILARA
jgi:CBS domain-containing protein